MDDTYLLQGGTSARGLCGRTRPGTLVVMDATSTDATGRFAVLGGVTAIIIIRPLL